MAYEKPKIVKSTYSAEPVEAGCCLRSCGGSPVVLSSERGAKDILLKLETVKKEKG